MFDNFRIRTIVSNFNRRKMSNFFEKETKRIAYAENTVNRSVRDQLVYCGKLFFESYGAMVSWESVNSFREAKIRSELVKNLEHNLIPQIELAISSLSAEHKHFEHKSPNIAAAISSMAISLNSLRAYIRSYLNNLPSWWNELNAVNMIKDVDKSYDNASYHLKHTVFAAMPELEKELNKQKYNTDKFIKAAAHGFNA